jgi:putative bacteriocin precursor
VKMLGKKFDSNTETVESYCSCYCSCYCSGCGCSCVGCISTQEKSIIDGNIKDNVQQVGSSTKNNNLRDAQYYSHYNP